MNFKYMFTPIQIGPVTVPNRFVVPPMSNNFALETGSLSERSMAYYTERARGGFGLITIEATVVERKAKGGTRKSCLYDDAMIEGLKKTVDACHEYGAKVSIQLQHAGPEGNAKAAGYPIKSASPIVAVAGRDVPEEITTEEIYDLIEKYGDAALRAKKAGVDTVEVHCAHGYLVSSFLSPQTNKRLDEFGGCFENRMRLPKLIIENIRRKVGHSMGIICRINSSDEVHGGNDVHDSSLIASYLESCGADALNISRSVHIHDEYMWAPTVVHGGFNLEHVDEIKKAVAIPIIMIGRFNDTYLPELLVKEGRCDLVAFGRQSIADPWLPNKAASNSLEELIPCIACLQGCVCNMFQGQPIACLANPLVGYEAELAASKVDTPKNVMVVGGGVGGLAAAWIMAARGHKVTLHEETSILGGQMRLAAFPPGKGDITNLVRSYIVLCKKYGVTIKLNSEVTEEVIKTKKPDAIVLATGAKPLVLNIKGIDDPKILHAVDVLAGKVGCGKKVLVVGGGLVGAETADFLGERGYDVTVVEYKEKVAMDINSEHRLFLMRSFEKNVVKMITSAQVKEFVEHGVIYATADGSEHRIDEYDTVVLALGAKAYNPLEEKVKTFVGETYVIGDAVQARRAIDATKEAREIALKI